MTYGSHSTSQGAFGGICLWISQTNVTTFVCNS